MTGILISDFNLEVNHVKVPLGTCVAIVGTLASCHPIPELMIFTPSFSTFFANRTISSQDDPFGTKSIRDNLKMRIKSLPTAALTLLTISNGNRILFS